MREEPLDYGPDITHSLFSFVCHADNEGPCRVNCTGSDHPGGFSFFPIAFPFSCRACPAAALSVGDCASEKEQVFRYFLQLFECEG